MMVSNINNLSEIKYALSECNAIRYAAYRTSSKLRVLQRSLLLNRITLEIVEGVCEKHHLTQIENSVRLPLSELENLLSDIFFVIGKRSENGICEESLCRSLVYTLLNVYDGNATNEIEVLSCKIFLAVLCKGEQREKLHFMYQQVADKKNQLTKEGLELLLERLVDIVEFLGEANAFGRHFIKRTVESCFKKESGTIWLSKESFMTWLAQDPQLLVWLTTLHRMQISEFILHHVKCGVCKTTPVMGLRYSCLKCLAYNMCQTCFFTGKTSKKHKLNHPIQEYCLPMTAKQCTKAFLLFLKNAFTKSNDKAQYLPVISVGMTKNDGENVMGGCSRSSACKRPLKELQSIILNLEMESEKLIPQIETFCEKMFGNNVELKSCILKHKSQIENQIRRLKTLRKAAITSDETEDMGRAPMASTPVVAGFSARNERKTTFSDGLEALSPIKLVLRPFADSSPKKREEKNSGKGFVWDNYDLCHADCFSWEEIKSDRGTNESAPTSSATAQCSQSVNDHDGGSTNRGDPDESFCLHEDSELFFREGFTWVRERSDRAAHESVACRSHARNAEDDFADVHLHLKNALQVVRDGLTRLRGPHDESEREGIHKQAEKVDSLLIDFINGFETFAGSETRNQTISQALDGLFQ